MSKFRTAMGKVIDMNALVAKNEKTRAVGNMNVNARGDTIDSTNRVIKPKTSKVNDSYAKTVGNRSAQPVKSKPTAPPKPTVDLSQLTEAEKEFELDTELDDEIAAIKAKEGKQ